LAFYELHNNKEIHRLDNKQEIEQLYTFMKSLRMPGITLNKLYWFSKAMFSNGIYN
jgi:hypothetical protein